MYLAYAEPKIALDLGNRFVTGFRQLDGFQLEFTSVLSVFGLGFLFYTQRLIFQFLAKPLFLDNVSMILSFAERVALH